MAFNGAAHVTQPFEGHSNIAQRASLSVTISTFTRHRKPILIQLDGANSFAKFEARGGEIGYGFTFTAPVSYLTSNNQSLLVEKYCAMMVPLSGIYNAKI